MRAKANTTRPYAVNVVGGVTAFEVQDRVRTRVDGPVPITKLWKMEFPAPCGCGSIHLKATFRPTAVRASIEHGSCGDGCGREVHTLHEQAGLSTEGIMGGTFALPSLPNFDLGALKDLLPGVDDSMLKGGVNVLEIVAITYAGLRKSTSFPDVMLCLLAAYKMLSKEPITYTAKALLDSCFTEQEQALEFSETPTALGGFRDSSLGKVIFKATTLAASSALLLSTGIGTEVATLAQAFSEGLSVALKEADFVSSVIDLVTYIVERVTQCWKDKSLRPFFHSHKTYRAWSDRAHLVIENDITFRLPGQTIVRDSEHMAALEDAIIEGAEIVRNIKASNDKDVVSSLLSRLRVIRATHIVRQRNGAPRESPFAVLVCGTTSVGKSAFIQMMYYHFGKIMDLPIDARYMYTRVFGDAYWTDFRSHMWAIILDDVSCPNPNKASEDASVADIIALINNVPFAPPQADIENKGTPARPKLVIATTNTPHLNAAVWFSNPAAVRRRFRYNIYIKPKKEFAAPDDPDRLNDALDPNPPPGHYFDVWDIEVRVVKSKRCGNADEITQEAYEAPHRSFSNIYAFYAWFNTAVDEFHNKQHDLMGAFENIRALKLCTACRLPVVGCTCTGGPTIPPDTPPNSGGSGSASDDPPTPPPLPERVLEVLHACEICGQNEATCQCISNLLARAHAQATEVALVEEPYTPPYVPYLGGALLVGTAYAMAPSREELFTRVGQRIRVYTRAQIEEALRNAAANIRENYGGPVKKLLAVLAAGAAAYGVYRYFSSIQSLGEQSVTIEAPPLREAGVAPKPKEDETPSPYQKEVMRRSDFDYPSLVRSWKSLEHTQVQAKISKNVCNIIVRRTLDGVVKRTDGVAVALGGHLYVTTNHNIPDDGDVTITFIFVPPTGGPSPNITKRYTQGMLFRVPGRELVFFQNRDYAAQSRMLQLLPPPTHVGDCPGALLRKTVDGEFKPQHLARISYTGDRPFGDRILPMWHYETPNKVGYCGSPIVAFAAQGPMIVALHYLGSDPRLDCYGVRLDSEIVAVAEKHFGDFLFSPAPPMLENVHHDVKLGPNHPKDVIMYMDGVDGTVDNYGTTGLPVGTNKSKVKRTILAEACEQAGFEQEFFAPAMKGWQVSRNQLMPSLQKKHLIDEHRLRECTNNMVAEILAGLSDEDKAEIATILDVTTATNGIPGTKFIDSMNFRTGAGFPVMGSKRKIIEELEPDEIYSRKITFNEETLQRVEEMRDRYLQGFRASPVAIKHNKDEPRKASKVEAFATRAINGLPADHTLLARMYLLPFIRVMMKNKLLFEAMPGLVAQGLEWDSLARWLESRTDGAPAQMEDGDFKWYDLLMEACVGLEVTRLILDVMRGCGASEEQLRVVAGHGEDMFFCFVIFDRMLLQMYGSNPSGQAGTVVYNCLANSLLSRYVFSLCNPNPDEGSRLFRLWVKLITYGDDSGKRTAAPWFDHDAMASAFESIGLIYTASDKSTGHVPLKPLSEMSFLKRGFRYDEDVGCYMAPLEESSIRKSLMVAIPSDDTHEYVDAGERVVNAAREYFFHGKNKFHEMVPVLKEILQKSVPEVYANVQFPTWDELREQFLTQTTEPDRYLNVDSWRRCIDYVLESNPGHKLMVQSREFVEHQLLSFTSLAVMVDVVAHDVLQPLITSDTHIGVTLLRIVGVANVAIRILLWTQDSFGVYWGSGAAVTPPGLLYLASKLSTRRTRPRLGLRQALRVMSFSWLLNTYVRAPGGTTDLLPWEKPIRWGNQMICYAGLHTSVESAEGPSRSGCWPEVVFTTGRDWEPVQSSGVIMDVGAPLNPSCKQNQTQPTFDTRSLVEVDLSRFSQQAEEFTESVPSKVVRQENLTFVDSGVGEVRTAPSLGPYRPDGDDGASLGSFLSRPVLINSWDWLETNATLVPNTFYPWTIFFSDPGIQRKLTNYARVRCKLHLKFVYNASPFYFGSMRACYFPLGDKQTISQTIEQVRASQTPGVYLEPQRATAAELELPMVWPGTWLDTKNLAEFDKVGVVKYVRYSKLRSANGVTSAKVRVSCYAWATEVELAGPTTFAVQSSEYDETGSVSGPASAVASLAGKLKAAPVIGTMAAATEIGANAVSGIARMFGFSNPPVIDDVAPMAPKSFHAFANVDTRMPVDKLTIDPKNEVTVDNTTAGADSEDELVMSTMLAKESFILGTGWDQNAVEGTQIFACGVTPALCQSVAIGTGATAGFMYTWTPASYFGQFFNQWRGSMTFKFKIIKSRYHTGRLIITWDPQGIPGTDYETLTFARLVDIQQEDEVVVTIPYKARCPWLDIGIRDQVITNGSAALVGFDDALHNGVLKVCVQTTLTGPAALAEVSVLCYVSGGPDLEYAVPRVPDPAYTFLQQQSEEVVDTIAEEPQKHVGTNVVTVGETIGSLRQLLHRANWVEVVPLGPPWEAYQTTNPTATARAGIKFMSVMFPRVPVAYGLNPLGSSFAQRLSNGAFYDPASQVRTPFINYVLNCFVGYRGSVIHHFNVISNGSDYIDSMAASRAQRGWIVTGDKAYRNMITSWVGINEYNVTAYLMGSSYGTAPISRAPSAWEGLSLTNPRTQSALSISSPHYSKWRFRPAWEYDRDVYPGDPTANEYESVRLSAVGRKYPFATGAYNNFVLEDTSSVNNPWPYVEHYVAAGTDFNPIYFVCVPNTYKLTTALSFNTGTWTPPT